MYSSLDLIFRTKSIAIKNFILENTWFFLKLKVFIVIQWFRIHDVEGMYSLCYPLPSYVGHTANILSLFFFFSVRGRSRNARTNREKPVCWTYVIWSFIVGMIYYCCCVYPTKEDYKMKFVILFCIPMLLLPLFSSLCTSSSSPLKLDMVAASTSEY